MNNNTKGNYEKRICKNKKCKKTFYIPTGKTGQMKLKNTRPRNCVTCSPECSKIYGKERYKND